MRKPAEIIGMKFQKEEYDMNENTTLRHETFDSSEEAKACQAEHPGSEITFKPGSPIMLFGQPTYEIPEAWPSWTVWWEE